MDINSNHQELHPPKGLKNKAESLLSSLYKASSQNLENKALQALNQEIYDFLNMTSSDLGKTHSQNKYPEKNYAEKAVKILDTYLNVDPDLIADFIKEEFEELSKERKKNKVSISRYIDEQSKNIAIPLQLISTQNKKGESTPSRSTQSIHSNNVYSKLSERTAGFTTVGNYMIAFITECDDDMLLKLINSMLENGIRDINELSNLLKCLGELSAIPPKLLEKICDAIQAFLKEAESTASSAEDYLLLIEQVQMVMSTMIQIDAGDTDPSSNQENQSLEGMLGQQKLAGVPDIKGAQAGKKTSIQTSKITELKLNNQPHMQGNAGHPNARQQPVQSASPTNARNLQNLQTNKQKNTALQEDIHFIELQRLQELLEEVTEKYDMLFKEKMLGVMEDHIEKMIIAKLS